MAPDARLVGWAQRVQAIAQNGLAFVRDPYDRVRWEQLRELAAEMLSDGDGAAAATLRALFEEQTGYATPRVDVRGAVFDERARLLLVRERADGGWTLPGGWADVGESLATAVEREVLEESGIACRAVRVLACWDRIKQGHPPSVFHSYKIALRCEPLGGTPAPSLEASEAAFFAEDEIPGLPLSTARTLPSQIARVFEHLRHPEMPTDFD